MIEHSIALVEAIQLNAEAKRVCESNRKTVERLVEAEKSGLVKSYGSIGAYCCMVCVPNRRIGDSCRIFDWEKVVRMLDMLDLGESIESFFDDREDKSIPF